MIKEVYVEFGPPSDNEENYKRYCGVKEFTPVGDAQVVRFVNYETYEKIFTDLLVVDFAKSSADIQSAAKSYANELDCDPVTFNIAKGSFVQGTQYLQAQLDIVLKIGVEGQREINRKLSLENAKLKEAVDRSRTHKNILANSVEWDKPTREEMFEMFDKEIKEILR